MGDRHSNQTWLGYNTPLLKVLRKRAMVVAGVPEEVINNSEQLQVVHYPKGGHYACHHDSAPDSIDAGDIRFATLGIFLNDVAQGGETAFPGSDREDSAEWGHEEWSDLEADCQPTPMCTRLGGLVVPARKGDGIFWYN